METKELIQLIDNLTKQSSECERIEFKENFHSNEEIGRTISALSNSTCLCNKECGYLIFGIKDGSQEVIGTTFKIKSHKIGKEDLEHWLASRLNPSIDFITYEFDYSLDVHISMFKIPSTTNRPISFLNEKYIRVGSTTTKLSRFPDKEAKIWKNSAKNSFEKEIKITRVILTKDDTIFPMHEIINDRIIDMFFKK